jgi:hypothetical protein
VNLSGFDPTLYGSNGSTGTQSPYGVDFSAAPSGKGKKPSKKTTKVAAPKTTPIQDLINGTISLGQGIINTVETPLYFIEDLAYRSIRNAKNPKVQEKLNKQLQENPLSYFSWMGGEWAKSAENATAWSRGQEVKHTGGAIAKELGLTSSNKDLGAKIQNTAVGLAFDVALDPLTYVPLAPVFKVLKGVSSGGSKLVTGAALGGVKGYVPIEKAAARGVTAETAAGVKEIAPKGKIKQKYQRPVGETGKGAEYQQTYLKGMEANKSQLVKVPDAVNRAASQKAKDAVATGLDMGIKALRSSLLTSNANKFLEKYAIQEAKAAKAGLKAASEVITPEAPIKAAEGVTIPKPSEAAIAAPKTVKTGRASFLDIAPTEYEKSIASLGTKDVKSLQKVYETANKIASKAKGVRLSSDNVAQSIEGIIKSRRAIDTTLFAKTSPEFQKSFIKGFDTVPLISIRDALSQTADVAKSTWAKAVAGYSIRLSDGTATNIGKLINSDVRFSSLPKPDQRKIITTIERFIDPNKADIAVMKRINELTGDPEITKQLAKAGAFTREKADIPKIKEILDKLGATASAGEVTYKNVDELIAGLRAGDTVSNDIMAKILKALDPDNKLVAEAERNADSVNGKQLSLALQTTGLETLAAMRKTIDLAANPETYLKATGLSSAEVLGAYLGSRLLGRGEAITQEVELTQRAAAAERVAAMGGSRVSTATTLISETFGTRWEQELDKLAKKGGHTRVSTFGDRATLGAKRAFSKEGAILADQANQSFQAIIASKAAGIGTYQATKKAKYLKPEEYAKFEMSRDKLKRFSDTMNDIQDVLLASGGGIRMQVQKVIEKGMKIQDKHVALIHMGDVARLFARSDEGYDAIRRAFFISGEGYEKRDSLDVVSILNTVRQAMEDSAKGLVRDRQELVDIASIKADKTVLTAKYQAELDKNASDFVDHLLTILPDFEALHLARAKGAVEDYLTVSMDLIPEAAKFWKEAWAINLEEGWGTPEKRFELIRSLFQRFNFLTDSMNQESGAIAYAVMNTSAMMFLKNGRIAEDSATLLDEALRLMPEAGTREYGDFMEMFNTYARLEKPDLAAPIGRERIAKPTKPAKEAVETDYKAAMAAIDEHRKLATKLDSAEALAEWQKTAKVLGKTLNKMRDKAWQHWLPVLHWSNVEKRWVDANMFDHAAEVAWIKKNPPRLIGDKIVNMGADMLDSVPVARATKADAATLAKATEEASTAHVDHAIGRAKAAKEDAATAVIAKQQEIDALPLDDGEKAVRSLQEFFNQQMEATRPEYYAYDPSKIARTKKPAADQEALTLGQRIAERTAVAGGMGEVTSLLQIEESILRKTKSDIAHALTKLTDGYPDLMNDVTRFPSFWTNAVKGRAIDRSLPQAEQEFQGYLNDMVSYLMNDANINNIDPELIANAFKHYGLTDKGGFGATGSVKDIFEAAPFGENPYPETSELFDKFKERQTAFNDGKMLPVEAIYKMGAAIQHAKMDQTLAAQLVANFSHEAAGLSASAAKSAGWVKMKSISYSPLANSINSGTAEVYFHPEIARNIAALDRAKEAMFNGKSLGKVATTIMTLTGYLKFTQTTLNLRHHVTNMLGDSSVEMMVGHNNPVLWHMATKMAREYAAQVLHTDYFKGSLDASVSRLFTNLGSPEEIGKGIEYYTKSGSLKMKMVIGGKMREVDPFSLIAQMEQRNIATSSMLNDEILGMYEHIVVDKAAIGAEREMNKTLLTKAKMGIEKGMKPFGDFAAAYSNIPRIAGALHVMAKRSWKSEEEMWQAVADHVHLYHPTISSLAPAERKYGRMFVGYYTWLRGAYTATANMMINHTAGVLITPKILSNVRQANEVDQTSMGTPWGANAMAPQNMRGSLYGPLWSVPGGVGGIKTSSMPLDVLDAAQFYYDPMLSPDQMVGANYKVLGSFLGGNANPIVRQIAQEMIGVDFQTGASYTDRGPQAQLERFILTLGPSQLAKGLGWQPSGKNYTQEQQQLFLRKYITGSKEFTTADPGIQKATNLETAARMKKFLANIQKENQ